jgi:oxygen-independent coproporphyrinogen-3 oxidase
VGQLKGLPSEDLGADMFDLTQEICNHAGLPAYEVSNHARPGAESRHNLTYWRHGDYAGIGPGAHGRFSVPGEPKRVTITERLPERWLALVNENGHGIVEEERLDVQAQADEMLLMGLRLVEGLDLSRFEALGAKAPATSRIEAMEALGMVERIGNARIIGGHDNAVHIRHRHGRIP